RLKKHLSRVKNLWHTKKVKAASVTGATASASGWASNDMADNLSPPGAFSFASAEPNLSRVKMSALAAIGRYLRFRMARSGLIKMVAALISIRRQSPRLAKGGPCKFTRRGHRASLFLLTMECGKQCGVRRQAKR